MASTALACASDTDPVRARADAGDAHVARQQWYLPVLEREVWLFVVDDANSAATITLREEVAAALRLPQGGPYASDADGCPGSEQDPSRQDPIDVRVIVAHPGEDPLTRLVTPNEIPELSRFGERDDAEAHRIWTKAVQSELLRAPSSEPSRYAPLETIADAVSLLGGQRLPSSLREMQQLAALGTGAPWYLRIFATTTRDDASSAEPASYDIARNCDMRDLAGLCPEYRLLAKGADGRYLLDVERAEAQGFTRAARNWTKLDQDLLLNLARSPDELFSPTLSAKTVYPCWQDPPVRHDDGSVDCHVHIVTRDLSPCDPLHGWIDPVANDSGKRTPTLDRDEQGQEVRVCEIRQLEGPELQRCLFEPEAPQYTAGYCYPEPSMQCRAQCAADLYPISLRFVSGATRSEERALLRIACTLESTD